jgi:lipoprotein-releasing system ATP-binding protein
MTSLIEARGVTKILEGVVPTTLVKDINLTIMPHEFIAITGPSGSGKSSLLYLLGLLDLPTIGDVLIDGRSTNLMTEDDRAEVRLSRIGFVFQFHFLLPEFSITENVALPMRALGRLSSRAATSRAEELLISFGLSDHLRKTPDQLSGGQRQRVAVARALANNPPVILADEPTGSLDSLATAQVFGILRDLVTLRDKTVVAVTHDLNLAAQMHRRIHVVDGKLANSEASALAAAFGDHEGTAHRQT